MTVNFIIEVLSIYLVIETMRVKRRFKSLHVLHISIDAFSKISVIIRHVDCLPSFIMLSVML